MQLALFCVAVCLVARMIKDYAASKPLRRFKYRSVKTVVWKLGVKYKLGSSSREMLISI